MNCRSRRSKRWVSFADAGDALLAARFRGICTCRSCLAVSEQEVHRAISIAPGRAWLLPIPTNSDCSKGGGLGACWHRMLEKLVRPKLVVIGNGMAGIRTVEELLARAPHSLASPCSAPSRTSTTTASCCPACWPATRAVDDIVINSREWYDENGIDADHRRCGRPRSTAAAQTVTAASGATVAYDRLLIATGSRPVRRRRFPGLGLPGVCAFRDIADVDKMLPRPRDAQARGGDRRRPAGAGSGLGPEAARHVGDAWSI